MPRKARIAPPNIVYHVLNRTNGKRPLFRTDKDFAAFEAVMELAFERTPIRILDWCLMPNHWHLVLYPSRERQMSEFVGWLTLTHTQRWKHSHAAVGHGALYQGRFKSFPIEQDDHLLTVLRYVERNPVRAHLARRAEDWRWGSCHVREDRHHRLHGLLSSWPVPRPPRWLETVNQPQTPAEERLVQTSIERNRPVGSETWIRQTAQRLDLSHTLRSQGRPKGWRKRKSASSNAAKGPPADANKK